MYKKSVIRGTFYRQLAEKLLNVKAGDLKSDPKLFEEKKKKIIGEEKIFFGYVKSVPEFDRKEFVVRDYYELNIDTEIQKLSETRR